MSTNHVPLWLQWCIWPLIRDTDCYYCIFIRGTVAGALLTAVIGGGVWAVLFR